MAATGQIGARGIPIRTAKLPQDRQAAECTIVLAFCADPAARWTYPHPGDYLTYFPRFVRAFAGTAFDYDTAHLTAGCEGAALWLPPGAHIDEDALEALIDETTTGTLRSELREVIDRMGSYHPVEPHWYLPMIGVDGRFQGRGYGSALLRHALALCDRDRTPAYLESSNPQNISLYQRHGFELIGTIQVGSSPKIHPMLRKPPA